MMSCQLAPIYQSACYHIVDETFITYLWQHPIMHLLYVFICRETWITFWRKRTILCLFPLFMEARCWSLWCVSSTLKMEVEHSCEMPVNFCQNIRHHPNPWRLCSWSIFLIWYGACLLKVLVNLEITRLPQCLGVHIRL